MTKSKSSCGSWVFRKSLPRIDGLTILALLNQDSRSGLLSGHACLADGARIHDILEFVRSEFGRKVAENTRETYRKTSLRPLLDAGWVVRHRLSTNDPNTHYRLNSEFAELLATEPGLARDRLSAKLQTTGKKGKRAGARTETSLSGCCPGQDVHAEPRSSQRARERVVEVLAPAILMHPSVVYLGDTAPRAGYQDRTLMRRLNLPIDVTESLPDVVVYSPEEKRLLVVEAVTSTGPISAARLAQLRDFCRGPVSLDVRIEYMTAFPSRKDLRRFIEEIAWGTQVGSPKSRPT